LSQEFPRVYRLKRAQRVVTSVGGILFLSMGLAGAAMFAVRASTAGSSEAGAISVMLFTAAVGAYLLALPRRVCVILHEDRLELRSMFTRQHINRADIAARRLITLQHGQAVLRLYSQAPGGRDLTLPPGLETDPRFDEWFAAARPGG
jgi:hypothetical protein